MKNRFNELNKKILSQCKNINDIEENIPFADKILEDEDEKNIYRISSFINSSIIGGTTSIAKGLINNYNRLNRNILNRNILNKINKFNKNETNIEPGSGQWTKLLRDDSIDEIIDKVNFNRFSIQHYLNHLKNECGLTFEEICEQSNHKESYIKPVFTLNKDRKRNPNRDCIIGLSFAFKLNTYEANYLLKAAGFNELYLRDKRDLIIAKGLLDLMPIKDVNRYLKKYNCEEIGNLESSLIKVR